VEIGVIAQQVEPIVPELVHTADDERQTKSVNYIGFIGYIIGAIQELKEIVFGKLDQQEHSLASVRDQSDNNSDQVRSLQAENRRLRDELDAVKQQNHEMNQRLQRIEQLLQQ
jgi:predicted RNase H-like nuclease (RuvC/YqgF family)